jgi:ParB family chromosome partitioning protein
MSMAPPKAKGKSKDPLPNVALEDLAPTEVPLDQIVVGSNPREDSTWKTDDLAKSIKQVGVLQPIRVRPMGDNKFEIIAGRRRYEAAKIAGLQSIPATAADTTDEDAYVQALVENLQREDLPPLDEARAFQRLLEDYGISQKTLGKRIGRSQPYISNALRMIDQLAPEVQEAVQARTISVGHAKELMKLEPEDQIAVAERVVTEKIPVADLAHTVNAQRSERDRAERFEKAKEAEFGEAIQALKDAGIKPEQVVVFHNKELADKVREAGYSAAPWESAYHQNPSYECDCDGLIYQQYGPLPDRLHRICLVQAHYDRWVDGIETERKKRAAEAKTVLTAERKKLRKAIGADAGVSSRLLLYHLLGDPFSTYGGPNDSAKFVKRHKGDPAKGLNGLWDVIAGMEVKAVNDEVITLLADLTLYNVFAENMRWENARTRAVREWLVDHAKLDPSVVWGGHDELTEDEKAEEEFTNEENAAEMGLDEDAEPVSEGLDPEVEARSRNSEAPTPDGRMYPTEKRETDPAQIQDADPEVYNVPQPSTEGNPEPTPAEEAGD